MECFTTEGLPGHRKLSFWNEVSSATFAPLDVVPRDRGRFEARLSRDLIGPLALANVYSSPGRIQHTRAHLAAGPDRGYVLLTAISGGFQVCADGRAFAVGVGDFCLLNHSMPYELTHEQPSQTFCVGFDGAWLRARIPKPEQALGVLMRSECGVARMLVRLLGALSAELESGGGVGGGGISTGFAPTLAAFLAAAYVAVVDVPQVSLQESWLLRIKQYVDEQLHDPQLHPAGVARHFGISARYLRLLFEAQREPLSQYILHRRLERCASMLHDRSWQALTITDVAFRHGFNNATHFGHAFKARFGMTPRDYRRTTSLP